ncbi:UNVERIFIED_ORG: hypothetical protein L601_000700001120 [Gordonia westfalica J30]
MSSVALSGSTVPTTSANRVCSSTGKAWLRVDTCQSPGALASVSAPGSDSDRCLAIPSAAPGSAINKTDTADGFASMACAYPTVPDAKLA